MKATFAAAVSVLVASVAAVPATSFTTADWKKYHCLTLDKYLTWTPPCATNCLKLGLDGGRDGCAPDDMVCHCQHTQRIDDYLVPCITVPSSPNATCSGAEIGTLQTIVTNLCQFYNATSYADYVGCSPKIQMEILQEALGQYN